MKIDFKNIILVSLDNEDVKDQNDKILTGHGVVASAIYGRTKILDLVDVAFQINRGEPVELSRTDLTEIKSLFDENSGVSSFIRRAICLYIDKQLEKDSNGK